MTPLVWIALALMVFGVVMLLAGVGASVVWFGAVAAGCALFVVDRKRSSPTQRS